MGQAEARAKFNNVELDQHRMLHQIRVYTVSEVLGLAVCNKMDWESLTLVLLNPDMPVIANSEDPDQLASVEAN